MRQRRLPLVTTALGLLWGLAQGIRHALEPDHLAAVSTLVAERRSPRSAAAYAVAWGAGHALVLLCVGGTFLLAQKHLPERLEAVFELGVAVMLLSLGARALGRSVSIGRMGGGGLHAHAVTSHAHPGPADHVHWYGLTLARRPLVVGCIHGLAGSGALAALVLAQMRSPAMGLVYMAVYGGGATLGMTALAGVAGLPLARLVKTQHGIPALLATTGVLSMALGVAWGWLAVQRI